MLHKLVDEYGRPGVISQAIQQVLPELKKAENHPQERLSLRQNFYSHYGFGKHDYGYGNSELAFLKWEIDRGALNPVASDDDIFRCNTEAEIISSQSGSSWWRSVNMAFLFFSETAGRIQQIDPEFTCDIPEFQYWLNYIRQPNSQLWYRAHNRSITRGYLICNDLAWQETVAERMFINEVFYRLMFAQAMEESNIDLIKLLADCKLPSVDIMVHMSAFYPRHYPLSEADVLHVMHEGHGLEEDMVKFLDEELIMPHLELLYSEVTKWIELPEVNDFQEDGATAYPHEPKTN